MTAKMDMRDSFITALYDVAKQDPDVLILSNDFGAPSLDRFRADLPKQFINAAISEQNMVSTAAGLAKDGKKVIVYSIATFVTLRSLEQIKIDLCVMNVPVTILAVGTGYAYSTDGPTHHATEDIAILRTLSNMTIYSPADSTTAAALANNFGKATGPTYLRFDRGKWNSLYDANHDFSAGMSVVRPGKQIALVSTGIMVHRALEVAEDLAAHGIDARVIDLYRLKPLPVEAFRQALTDVDAVVSIEEQTKNGALGGLVAETMADLGLVKPLKRFAIDDDKLYDYGMRDRLHKERGLDRASIASSLVSWLGGRGAAAPASRSEKVAI